MPDEPSNPFDRVKAEAARAAAEGPPAGDQKAPDLGEHIAPAPGDAPPMRTSWRRGGGEASAVWRYHDAQGRLLRATLRFPKAGAGEEDLPRDRWSGKDVLPCTLWRDRPGKAPVWRLKAEPGPRPLYGLDRLAARPAAPVLMVEGEKDCDGATSRFPAFVCVTWPGGSNAIAKADLSPLAGREVVIWSDADAPGQKAAKAASAAAIAAGAVASAVVDPPAYFPDGWGLADDWPEGFDQAKAEGLIAAARDRAAPGGVEWPFGFEMRPEGLFYEQPVKDGRPMDVHISGPFLVLGEVRDPDGGGWGKALRFRDRDGRLKTVIVANSRLSSGGAEVRGELADAGLFVSPARGKADKFAIALASVRCRNRLTTTAATGWIGARFVLPCQVVGGAGSEPVMFTGEAPALHYGQRGTLDGWRQAVATKAEGNTLLTFALSLAFLGPLMRPLEIEGGGVHFRGSSSCGKTTLAHAAGSVWGGGGQLGFGHSWRSTANALEMIAFGHNDGLLVLDELALVAPEEAGGAAYALASGQSKARSKADGSLRRRPEWRVAILSTGEIGLADHIRSSKKGDRPMAGQELRLLDVAAEGGAHMGVWEALYGLPGPAELSDAIKAASAAHYGQAGPAFVERLIIDREAAIDQARAILQGFMVKAAREHDTGQTYRAAMRFGAIAAAGELACVFGIVPWAPGAAAEAALKLFHRWAEGFGRDAPREEREILRRLRGVILSERSAFAPLGDDDTGDAAGPSAGGRDGEARSLRTYGYRHVRGPEVRYCFHDQGWAEVFKGHNLAEVARVVEESGFLETDGDKKRLKKSIKIRGERQRLYVVFGSIMEADLGD